MRYPVRLLVFALISAAISGELCAQRVDTIYANPQATPLHKVWEVSGRQDDLLSAGGSVKLTDSTIAWYTSGGVNCTNCGWYRWDQEGDSALKFQGNVPAGGCTGRFFGTDERYLASVGSVAYTSEVYVPRIRVMRYVDSAFDTTAIVEWDGSKVDSVQKSFPIALDAVDLDQDGADELLVLFLGSSYPIFDSSGHITNTVVDMHPRLWIYRGGPAFTLDTPTTILLDSFRRSGNSVSSKLIVGRFDSDALPDVATIFEYRINGHDSTLLSVWTNLGHSWAWSDPTVRASFPDAHVGDLGRTLIVYDADGDGQLDCLYPLEPFSLGQHALFLSRTGGSFLERLDSSGALRTARADRILQNTEFDGAFDWGPLSDSSERYAVLGFLRRGSYVGLSGGPNGPDASWDATGSGLLNPQPVGDATRDGWSDLLVGNPGAGAYQGYAALYAGGPYIPHDPTVGVEWTAVAGEHTRAIATWPNPATDLVHIAWRGDLRAMPRSFRIHDAAGSLVAEGAVPAGTGEARWNCAERPSGAYTLTVLDANNHVLATMRLLIQR